MPNQNILRRIALNNSKMRNSAAVRAAEDSILSCIKILDSSSSIELDGFNKREQHKNIEKSLLTNVTNDVRNYYLGCKSW